MVQRLWYNLYLSFLYCPKINPLLRHQLINLSSFHPTPQASNIKRWHNHLSSLDSSLLALTTPSCPSTSTNFLSKSLSSILKEWLEFFCKLKILEASNSFLVDHSLISSGVSCTNDPLSSTSNLRPSGVVLGQFGKTPSKMKLGFSLH